MLPQEALGENGFLASSSFRGCLAFFDVWLQVSHSCLLASASSMCQNLPCPALRGRFIVIHLDIQDNFASASLVDP